MSVESTEAAIGDRALPSFAEVASEEDAVKRGQQVVFNGSGTPMNLIREEWLAFIEVQVRRQTLLPRWVYAADICREDACEGLSRAARMLRLERFLLLDGELQEARQAWKEAWAGLSLAAMRHQARLQLHSRIFEEPPGVGHAIRSFKRAMAEIFRR